ncbi:forkhead box protein N1 [Esox lucius]|uniref:Fork-head domain-containing protein n=1 Tax=Esox lucius TaxID=8010 RepID=A0A3P8XPB4_ESOLU|nr:forkhead box protein N1 [Esox lucius]
MLATYIECLSDGDRCRPDPKDTVMSTDSPSSRFSPSINSSLTKAPTTQTSTLCNCEPPGIRRQPQCEESTSVLYTAAPQEGESATYRPRNAVAETGRRHSADGAPVSRDPDSTSGSGEADRFHPYRRQFSDGGVVTGGLAPGPPGSHPFICLQEEEAPDSFSTIHTPSSVEQTSWYPYNGSFPDSTLMQGPQHSYPEPPAAPEEPSCFLSQSNASYSPPTSRQQFPTDVYSTSGQSNRSQFALQGLSALPHQDCSLQALFPKPIYSYSILIFMALKNSKTGSLPVSEIYSFMTEHFPYFKTAPDGWKNSVRHNLSLNKCFEKVENKTGNSSRKGCLWALNPAKVEKMQEELHKWRRKDPLTVRKSMARPEDLDRLLGERPEKPKFLPSYQCQNPLSRCSTNYKMTPSPFAPSQPCEHHSPPLRCPLYPHVSSPSMKVSQHPSYLSPTTAHPFPFYSPCIQQPSSGVHSNVGTLGSPLVEQQTPTTYGATLHADYGVGHRSMQELLLEGEANSDIDTLNPSLTDMQLHGYLWEELREDSMAPDSLVLISPSPSSSQPTHLVLGSSLRSTGPVNQTPEVITVRLGKEEEDGDEMRLASGGPSDTHIDGMYHTAYPGMESLAGYLTTYVGNNCIPLL